MPQRTWYKRKCSMKSTLYLKFIVIYIIFGFLSFFTVGILSSQLVLDRLEKNDSQNLYRQANLVASDYLPSYFTGDSTSYAVHSQLNGMNLYLNSSLWFVESDGTIQRRPRPSTILTRRRSGATSISPEIITVTSMRT